MYYEEEALGVQRLDMLIDGKVIVEVKSTLVLHTDPIRRLYNYLKATNIDVGLFFHFGKEANFRRVICTNDRKER